MRYLIQNGSIINPPQRVAAVGHLLIEDQRVAAVYSMAELPPDLLTAPDVTVINANGCMVAPGFTDLHVHLRVPGEEYKETIATGTHAAAQGGFTTVCCMPNTQPAIDHPAIVREIRSLALSEGMVQVDVIGAISQGRGGTTLTEMADMVDVGCVAFSDDGSPVSDPQLMRNAMAYAAALGVPIMSHCEDTRLNAGWAMHEGVVSTRLGLPGYPAAAEETMLARDIALAEATGAHLHVCHVSTAGGVALIRSAKERGVHVTAEVTPHHLTLTDTWVLGNLVRHIAAPLPASSDEGLRSASWLDPTRLPPYDPSTRVSPPLRTAADVEALLEGLNDDTIDAIATDHAPHAAVNKHVEYRLAACGISGLETALGLVMTLVHTGALDMMRVVEKLTEGPARILRRAPSSLQVGATADLVIFDPEATWIVDTAQFVSKGKNSPLHGQHLRGQVKLTMVNGAVVYQREGFGAAERTAPAAYPLAGILNDGDDEE